MRVRNPQTGTVIGVAEATAQRYLSAGWQRADEPSSAESAPEPDGEPTRTRRRRAPK